MKKILSLLMLLVAIVTGAKAGEVTYNYFKVSNSVLYGADAKSASAVEGFVLDQIEFSHVVESGTAPALSAGSGQLKILKNSSAGLKIAAHGKTITKIEMSNWKNDPTGIQVGGETITCTEGTLTWTGSATEVVFYNTEGSDRQFGTLKVTYDGDLLENISSTTLSSLTRSGYSEYSIYSVSYSTSPTAYGLSLNALNANSSMKMTNETGKLTLKSTKAIKSVVLTWDNATDVTVSNEAITKSGVTNTWEASNTTTTQVAFLNASTSGNHTIQSIQVNFVGAVDPEFSLSADEVEVGKTITVNGPSGLSFTATPIAGTGSVTADGGTITGATAGTAQVRVQSDAVENVWNAYDHTFDVTVTAAKIATTLSFGTPTTTVARGGKVTNTATLTETASGDPVEGTITYSSDNEAVATVDASTGEVTGVKAGTANIKANYAGDATYSAADEVSYEITVTLPELVAVDNKKWTSASLTTAAGGAKDYTSADVLDNLEIVGTSTALRITTGGDKTIDGETFGGRVRFGKAGSADGNYVHFKVTPNSSITIWGIRATSGAEADGLAISVGAFGENEKVYSFVGGDVESMTYLYTGDADADVYAYSKNTNGASMMEIKVAPIQYETITTENNVATYVTQNALDFTDLETKAYVVTGISNEKTYVTTEEVTIVPAGTALLVKGATVDVPVIGDAAAPATNLLQISTGEGVQGADDIFAYSKTEQKFKKVDSSIKVPAGKCYLVIEGVTGSSLDIDFNGATAVEAVAEANEADAETPVKVIKNGKLFIGNYNVAGQLVK